MIVGYGELTADARVARRAVARVIMLKRILTKSLEKLRMESKIVRL